MSCSSAAERLFVAGLEMVLGCLNLRDLVAAASVCKVWHRAAHAMPARNLGAFLHRPFILPRMVHSPLAQRHVRCVTVYPSSPIKLGDLALLANLPRLHKLWIGLDEDALGTYEPFTFPPTLVDLRCKFISREHLPAFHIDENGKIQLPVRDYHLLPRRRPPPAFFSSAHFAGVPLEALDVDLPESLDQQLDLSGLPGLRSFRYRVDGSLAEGAHTLFDTLCGGRLKPVSHPLTRLEAIDLSECCLTRLHMLRLTPFHTSLTELCPCRIDVSALPCLVEFVQLRRLSLCLLKKVWPTMPDMDALQLLAFLPRSLVVLTVTGLVIDAAARAQFFAALPLLQTLN
jgi:hypothetical protein